jgi:hypothetical protein
MSAASILHIQALVYAVEVEGCLCSITLEHEQHPGSPSHDETSGYVLSPSSTPLTAYQVNEENQALLDRCVNTPLLVIDDIDKAKHTDAREEVYFTIIDARTNAALPTAISTNRIEDLADYVGGAVCSRLKVGQIAVEMTGAAKEVTICLL